ncbi:aldehyde dehydrogenase [Rhodococcus sp. WS4]|nr:aldehyde dehydrogenase [Rhodococcus sp. WS4]
MVSTSPDTLHGYTDLFIGGKWTTPSTSNTFEVISPTTEEELATVPAGATADIDLAVSMARKAFDEGPWPRMTPAERAEAMRRVSEGLERRIPDLNAAFTAEIGAPGAVGEGFHSQALKVWNESLEYHKYFAFEESREWPGGSGRVIREPIGVVAVVLPWNGPVTLAALKIAPALAAGCTVVVKPAPEGPLTSMILAEIFEAAKLPEGVISIIPADREVGEHLVKHHDVDKVNFTGSTLAGKRIMSICGERIARVALELGGKSAAIIADDIDLDSVFPELVFHGIGHSGQVCSALTRILVPRERQTEVVQRIKDIMESTTVGDPRDPSTIIGPLAMERQRTRVENYIAVGKEEGARLITGGGRPKNLKRGWFVEPTLFADVTPKMRIAQEEIFGPVLAVLPFDGLDDAIQIANDSDFGLSGAIYAKDIALAEQLASRVRAGQICINSWQANISQPYGGYKQSGLGRDGGIEGFAEYFETKVIQHV